MEYKTEYVEIGVFVTVVIALVTLIIGVAWVIVSKLIGVKEQVGKVETQNTTDIKNIDALWEAINDTNIKMDELNQQRHSDVLLFTKAINELNLTLSKIEGTMERMDKRLGDQDKEIDRLRER